MKYFTIVFIRRMKLLSSIGLATLALVSTLLPRSTMATDFVTADRLPLSTKGQWIVDKNGKKVKLACVNWYGAHMETYAPGGLQSNTMENIVKMIHDMGFNCLRYPLAVTMWFENPRVPDVVLAANPDMIGMTGENTCIYS